MRAYETIIILKHDVPDGQVAALTKKIDKVIGSKPGELLHKEDWGLRKLAYEIQKQRKGRYLFWSFLQMPEAIRALDRAVRFDENVLRFMNITLGSKKDWDLKQARKKPEAKKPESTDEGEGDYQEGRKRRGRRGNPLGDPKAVIDYKDIAALSSYVSERGKIVPRRVSGVNAFQQRAISKAIKRARELAMLSYTQGTPSSPRVEEGS